MTVELALFALAAFAVGAIPFSLFVGFVFLGVDIRNYGDGNPGTFNVIRAGGVAWGGLALMLDVSKGAAPVGLATHIFNISGWPLIAIALAPILGHAFSPFLKFQGGKAIATTGGVMIGLSLWQMPLVGMIALVLWYILLTSSGWAVMFTLATVMVYLFITNAPVEWVGTITLVALLMIYKHRAELVHPPKFKRQAKGQP